MSARLARGLGLVLATALAAPLLVESLVAEEIVITDQEGREVRLDKPAERIVTIPMPMATSVIAIDGGADKLVGVNPLSLTAIQEGMMGRMFPGALEVSDAVTATNFMPNVEALAAVDPDLVVQWGGRGPEIVDPITNAGLTPLLITIGTEDFIRQYMLNVGTALGKAERVNGLIAWRESVEAAIAAKAATIPEADRPSVLYLGRSLSDITASGAPNSYNNWYINLVGGRNAAAELKGSVSINREQIAQWNPEIILLNSFEPDLDVSWVYDDPILSLTNAAQQKRVYKLPLGGYRWDPPNEESPLTWMWLAELLHPDLYDFDLKAEMQSAYQALYNYALTNDDIASILRLNMQGDSRNYDQFTGS
jgi:iron complex transport system substrate-binding protein